jgi:two-component system, NarL family, invasion response regulator UvrY
VTAAGGHRMRILVADRNVAVRSAVTVYLQSMLELDTVREAGEGEDLLAQAELFRPDIVLLDWGWPGPARTKLLASLRAFDPRPSVIVLGSLLDQGPDALAAGADHFVCKGDSPRRLLAAVRLVEADRGAA